MTSNETNDKLWIVLCHLSLFIGAGVILPLIVGAIKASNDEFYKYPLTIRFIK